MDRVSGLQNSKWRRPKVPHFSALGLATFGVVVIFFFYCYFFFGRLLAVLFCIFRVYRRGRGGLIELTIELLRRDSFCYVQLLCSLPLRVYLSLSFSLFLYVCV